MIRIAVAAIVAPPTDRWEWRTFGADFGAVEARLRLKATSVRSSRDVYVTGPHGHEDISIRDGQLEIKALAERNADGLQRWRPIATVPFPIDLTRVRDVFSRLGVSSPDLHRTHYTIDQWLSEAVERVAELNVCRVTKERHASTIEDCLVEIAYLAVDAGFVKTIAVQHEDAAAAAATVRSLGFQTDMNEDYLAALKRFARTGYCKTEPGRARA